MKIIKYILTILVLGAVIFLITKGNKSASSDSAVQTPVEEARQLCYVWNTEAGDSATLRMTFTGTGGTEVTGSFNWEPAEKDSKVGVFEGTAGPLDQQIMARTAEVWWHTAAEGTTATEQLLIQFGDGTAAAAFGEMKDRGDGTYIYADLSNLSYAPALAQTDCGDEAVR